MLTKIEVIKTIREVTDSDLRSACKLFELLEQADTLRLNRTPGSVDAAHKLGGTEHPNCPKEVVHSHPELEKQLSRIAEALEQDQPDDETLKEVIRSALHNQEREENCGACDNNFVIFQEIEKKAAV